LSVRAEFVDKRTAAWGGSLAKYLLPNVVRREAEINPNAKGTEAWGWLPPTLVGEGKKVQPDWLFDFLLNPRLIRPASVLRMPRYNLSPEEATLLVRYFAAVDRAEFPYVVNRRRQADQLAAAEKRYQAARQRDSAPRTPPRDGTRLGDAMGIVTNSNYCIKCHFIGDFDPQGSPRSLGPDLAHVYRRLRPDYVRQWIANPRSVLPYTGMPVNIPYDPGLPNQGGIRQDLFRGTSLEQLDGLVDLLMNYDEYAKQRSPVTPLVKPI
jgi:cbb3-type cytochrome oxidase cytochrome c subunit